MGNTKQPAVTGNKVLFIGGPEAGNVRLIPESFGDKVKGDGDYIYQIYPVAFPGSTGRAFFAYAANQHPQQMFIDMWREYSPAAQIRRKATETPTYQKVT